MNRTLAFLILLPGFAAAQAPELTPGNRFPDWRLPSIDGSGPRSVSDFRGRKVVLHVFASW